MSMHFLMKKESNFSSKTQYISCECLLLGTNNQSGSPVTRYLMIDENTAKR